MVAPDGDLAGVVLAHAVIPSQGAGHLRRRSGTWQGMQTSVTICAYRGYSGFSTATGSVGIGVGKDRRVCG